MLINIRSQEFSTRTEHAQCSRYLLRSSYLIQVFYCMDRWQLFCGPGPFLDHSPKLHKLLFKSRQEIIKVRE